MKTIVAILFALVSLPASAHIAPDPMPQAPTTDVVASAYYDLDELFPENINLPEMVIEGQVPTVAPKKVSHVAKVWYCGAVYENALGGHNQDCVWKEVK